MDAPGINPPPAGIADLDAARASQGPLPAAVAHALLDRGRERLDVGEPQQALADFQRVVGHGDPALTSEAWLGTGDALYRLDAEGQALRAWDAVTKLPETPSTYRAWRSIAGARVRANELAEARDAYREADRRAPAADKAEIASRLGWLNKELGNSGAANRYFARSRGSGLVIGAALGVVAITVLVSVVAFLQAPATTWPDSGPPAGSLYALLWLDPTLVVQGQVYRLLSVVLLHSPDPTFFLIHLGSNMYALYLVGPIVEQIWGWRMFLTFYVLTGIAASTASLVFSAAPAVGASGAIFGLIGILFAGTRVHHPMLDRRTRAIVGQLGFLILLNLGIGFAAGGFIDNAAHIGGLVSGIWLGLVVQPGKVPTLRSVWQHPGGQPTTQSPLLVAAGILLLVAVIALGLAFAGVQL
ncbi:MAG TPA: rhomboid family intramembrane serine protease [Candidatus Limnocylindrales bacterium]|nr:rhomboid family intramembrane serine protease [Candidatus Limnocylindrales bacterium]